MTDDTTTTTEATETGADKTFTQADVDKIVKERLTQQARNKYGDYDELKAKAEGAKSVEDKLADLEAKHAAAEARALRSEVAARYGITPEDRDLFLTGSDEATLDAQAKRLSERDAEKKKSNANVARKEGEAKRTGTDDSEEREFVSSLFGGAD